MKDEYQKGSEWRKWDLQVQTYIDPRFSWPSGYPSDDVAKRERFNPDFIQHCIDNDISVVAITDHNSGEAIDGLLKENKELGEPISILPGVEVISSEGIHILAIFNPLSTKNRWDSWGETTRQFLTAISMPQPAFHGGGNTIPATANETAENIIKKIDQFEGITIFPHANSTNGGLFCESDSRTRKRLLKLSNILDAAADVKNALNRIQEFEQKLKNHQFDSENFAFINTSDSRKIADVGSKFTWIKANPTFEGLQQVLYEPKDRVAIQKDDPTPIKSSYSISRISFSESKISDELSIKKTELPLNHALVAIVGGKGTGKTALVDLVANCYMDRCAIKDRNSFVRRIVDHDPDLETKLTFRDGSDFSKKLKEQKFVEEGQFVYISQGELEQYVGDKSDLDQYIRDLIFESPLVKDTAKSYEYFDAIDKVKSYEEKVLAKNDAIQKLEQETGTDAANAIEKEEKQNTADLGDIEQQIKELEKAQSKDNIRVAKEKQEAIGKLKDCRDDLISARDLIKEAEDFLEEQALGFNKTIEAVNGLFIKLGIKTQFKDFTYPQVKDLTTQSKLVKKQITKTIMAIETAQKDLDRFEQSVKKHAKLLERQRELKVVGEKIRQKNTKLEEERGRLEQVVEDRNKLVKKLLEGVILQRKKYKEIIDIFSSKKDEVLSDLDFIAEIHFDDKKFLRKAYTIVDNRKINIDGDDKTPPLFEEFIKCSLAVADGDKNKIDPLIEEMTRLDKLLKLKLKGEPVNTSDFYNFLYGNYMEVSPVVQYKKTDLEKLSLGQKATVLIKIYLAQGDKPIVIDSHDDHLDNEFIMDELVKAIRQAKNFRQVILVSNNGNVVVNSDAEQIIVANRVDGEISYTSGAIEESVIREKAIKVLEGGTEAFRRRKQKYRILDVI